MQATPARRTQAPGSKYCWSHTGSGQSHTVEGEADGARVRVGETLEVLETEIVGLDEGVGVGELEREMEPEGLGLLENDTEAVDEGVGVRVAEGVVEGGMSLHMLPSPAYRPNSPQSPQ